MGMIRARISDDLEEQIQERIEKLKESSRGGMEINMSTVIRYALEKYIQEQDELDKGIETLKIDVSKLNREQLKKVSNSMDIISKLQSEDADVNKLVLRATTISSNILIEDIKREKGDS
ncbi:hypothetical protein FDB52_00750 [Clostridium botulinum]|nr:hypothetical protein [Clostridium botulinum]NFN47084.1 hypothetical protein [Clostridium botulinum]